MFAANLRQLWNTEIYVNVTHAYSEAGWISQGSVATRLLGLIIYYRACRCQKKFENGLVF